MSDIPLSANLSHTAGNGNLISRVNCNEYVELITTIHSFVYGDTQNVDNIRDTVPSEFLDDFNRGFNL